MDQIVGAVHESPENISIICTHYLWHSINPLPFVGVGDSTTRVRSTNKTIIKEKFWLVIFICLHKYNVHFHKGSSGGTSRSPYPTICGSIIFADRDCAEFHLRLVNGRAWKPSPTMLHQRFCVVFSPPKDRGRWVA